MNIFSYLKDLLSTDFVENTSSYVNEESGKVESALHAAVLSVLVSFLKRTSNESGAKAMFKAIEREKLDGRVTASLPGVLKDREQASQIVQRGGNLFSHLLPDKRSTLVAMISSHGKIRNSSATAVLGLVSFVTLDTFGKLVRDQNLDATGLAILIRNQKDYLLKDADAEMIDKVAETLSVDGITRLGYVEPGEETLEEPAPSRTRHTSEHAYDDLNSRSVSVPWKGILAVALVVAVLGAAWFGWSQFGDSLMSNADTTSSEEVAVPQDSTASYPDTTARPAVPAATTPTAATTTPTTGGTTTAAKIAQHMSDPLAKEGKIFVMNEVKFDPATNEPTPQSTPAIDDLAAVLKKYPTVQLKFTGVTVRPANKKNVFKQANSLKVYLTKAGVSIVRLDSGSFLSTDSTSQKSDFVMVKIVHQ